ncbi:MAG: LCP family protein [Candidatus Dormibacteria bacterium]
MASRTATRRRRSSYNVLPRWARPRRLSAVAAVAVVTLAGVFAVRTIAGIAHLTRQSPLSVIGDVLGGGGGSSVGKAVNVGQRINIAMYGYGGPGHDGAYLSDSILVVSIQPRASGPPSVAEISVPRDWYVPIILGNGKTTAQRINTAYSDGMSGEGPLPSGDPAAGGAVANATLEHLLGIHIDHWVGLDFTAFKSAVDAVGGITVDVPDTFTDYAYPADACDQNVPGNCRYITIHFNAGVQHMNGEQALEFSRSRHSNDNGEGSDFARSRRQQLVVAALKSKVVSLGGLGNLPDLLNSLGDNVVTDLHVNDIEALYSLLKDVNTASVLHVSFDDTNFLYECGYPANCGAAYIYAHDRSYKEVQHYVQNIFVSPETLSQKATVTIEDGSGRGLGASNRWASLLGMIGLKTTDGGTVPRQSATEVIDMSGGKDAATARWLATYFGVSLTTPATPTPAPSGAAASAPEPGSGGVLVILGTDEENAFLHDPGVGT